MNRKIAYLLGAIATVVFGGEAQAATVSTTWHLASGEWHLDANTNSGGYASYSHPLADFNGLTKNTKIGTLAHPTHLTGADLYGPTHNSGSYIRNGSSHDPALWLSPSLGHPNGQADGTNFLAVEGGSTATFALSSPAHYVGFLWGSVDKGNMISFFGKNGLLATFTGADMPNSQGKTGLGGTFYANFTTSAAILKVVLSSVCDGFEIDDVRVSAVPVPAALPLFGIALAGLGMVSRRRRKLAAIA